MFFLVDYLYIIKNMTWTQIDSTISIPDCSPLLQRYSKFQFYVCHHCWSDPFIGMFFYLFVYFLLLMFAYIFVNIGFSVKLQVQRLKNTKDRLSPKYKKLLDDMTSYMDPTRNFSKYRNLISNSSVSEYFFTISQIQYKSTYLVN